jgi:hypothetical protein
VPRRRSAAHDTLEQTWAGLPALRARLAAERAADGSQACNNELEQALGELEQARSASASSTHVRHLLTRLCLLA